MLINISITLLRLRIFSIPRKGSDVSLSEDAPSLRKDLILPRMTMHVKFNFPTDFPFSFFLFHEFAPFLLFFAKAFFLSLFVHHLLPSGVKFHFLANFFIALFMYMDKNRYDCHNQWWFNVSIAMFTLSSVIPTSQSV